MALGLYFAHKGLTPEKYAEAVGQLEAAGAGAPEGRIHHFALERAGEIEVFDIWESWEAFNAFGGMLVPVLAGLGVELSESVVARVHDVTEGQPVAA
jgi:hypothetical protein